MARRLKVRDFKSCLAFIGASDRRVDCGADFLGIGALTLAFWIKPSSLGEGGAGRVLGNGSTIVSMAAADAGYLRLRFRSESAGNALSSTKSFKPHQWVHVIITRDAAGVANFYINGVANGTVNQNSGTPALALGNFMIGVQNTNLANEFDGKIDGVRAFNRVLTAAEIANLYYDGQLPTDAPTSLMCDYNFNEGQGSTAEDSTGTAEVAAVESQMIVTTPVDSSNYTTERLGEASGTQWRAMPFFAINGFLDSVVFRKGSETGTFTGTVEVSIQTDDGSGNPSGNKIFSSTYSNVAWLALSTNSDITLSSMRVALTPGTKYHLVFKSSTADSSNYTRIYNHRAQSSPTGAGNQRTSIDGTTWVTGGGTLYHKIITTATKPKYTGTISGALFSDDVVMRARQFLRKSDYGVNLDGSSSASIALPAISQTSLSLSAWIRTRVPTTNQAIFGRSAGQSDILEIKTDKSIRFTVNLTTDLDFNTINSFVMDTNWHHVVATYDSTTGVGCIYVDGIKRATASGGAGAFVNIASTWRIGALASNSRNFNGQIDNARLWDYALTEEEAYKLWYTGQYPRTNLKGDWMLDEGTGTSATDSSGNANTGTLDTGATYTTDTKFKNRTQLTSRARLAVRDFGTSLLFDGVDDYVEVPHNVNQLVTAGLTLSAWVFILGDGESSAGAIIDKSTSTNGENGFNLRLRTTSRFRLTINGTTLETTTITAPNIKQAPKWVHIVVTVEPDGTARAYVNGTQVNWTSGATAQTQPLTDITTTNAMRFGNRSGGTDRSFNGFIDTVRIWNRALSFDEIKRLYFDAHIIRDGLIGEYLLNEGSGAVANDTSASANHGSVSGATYSTLARFKNRTAV